MMTKPHMPKFEDETITAEDGSTVGRQRLVCTCAGWASEWAPMTPLGLSGITAAWRTHVTRAERGETR